MRLILVTLAATFLSACASHSINDYGDEPLEFDPQVFFNNQIIAEGVVRNRSGKATRYFTADIKANWNDNGGELDEVFQWSDGEIQTRVWTFEKTGNNEYIGKAGDVKKTATMRHRGNALHMTYVLNVPLENGNTVAINMDDWMFQVSDNTIINVTKMTKFGFRVGEVVLTMRVVD